MKNELADLITEYKKACDDQRKKLTTKKNPIPFVAFTFDGFYDWLLENKEGDKK